MPYSSRKIYIQDQLLSTGYRSSGFDYLRIILAISVVAWHSIEICHGLPAVHLAWASPLRFLVFFILPSFFCLSGFLVAGSLVRVQRITTFLSLRAIRIFPALAVEVLLSALLIGPIVTDIKLRNYFLSPVFYNYFLNVIGDIHYLLPGVFTKNPMPTVNAQLWTVPYELYCYIMISLLFLCGLLKKRYFILFAIVALLVFAYITLYLHGAIPDHFDRPPGKGLLVAFLSGIALFIYRDIVPFSVSLFLIATGSYVLLMFIPQAQYLVSIPIAYMTVFIGLTDPHKIKILTFGDYSYGIYLYGYPIQQLVAYLMPRLHEWSVNFFISLGITFLIAVCSWHFVEWQVISRRKIIVRFVEGVISSLTYQVRACFDGQHRRQDRVAMGGNRLSEKTREKTDI